VSRGNFFFTSYRITNDFLLSLARIGYLQGKEVTMADTTNRGLSNTNEDMKNTVASQGTAASQNNPPMATIGQKGGKSQGEQNNPGNYANDRQKAQDAGRLGGSK
jgi:general stress protein YciG